MRKFLDFLLGKRFLDWEVYKRKIDQLEQEYWEEETKKQEKLFKSK